MSEVNEEVPIEDRRDQGWGNRRGQASSRGANMSSLIWVEYIFDRPSRPDSDPPLNSTPVEGEEEPYQLEIDPILTDGVFLGPIWTLTHQLYLHSKRKSGRCHFKISPRANPSLEESKETPGYLVTIWSKRLSWIPFCWVNPTTGDIYRFSGNKVIGNVLREKYHFHQDDLTIHEDYR